MLVDLPASRRAVSHRRRHRLCRPHDRWASGNLADSQHPLPGMVAAPPLRRDRGGRRAAAAISSALNQLEARAQFDGPEQTVHVRVAEHDGRIYLDLADEHWRAVEIGPERMASHPLPARALPPDRRHASAAAPGARRIDRRLWRDFSIFRAERFRSGRGLAVGGTAMPAGPIRYWAYRGEQGSAKTFLTKVLRGPDRSQRRPGAGAAARRARALHRRPQRPHAGLRQSLQHAALDLRRALSAGQRRQLRGPPALYRRG